jgi:RNA polymerase sigma-70 factor (ECF subfamily)
MMTPDAMREWMSAMRPKLHRYCARMLGSAFDGEDVVQEAMARAAQALGEGVTVEQPERWLFRIAHNAALDAIRRRRREARMEGEDSFETMADPAAAADARASVTASLAAFLTLAPAQRASVALVDVLGHSAEEVAATLDTSIAAVKAALHRGRARLREFALADAPVTLDSAERAKLSAYAERFNAHDWDALRAMLADDVRLDLVARTRLAGRGDVGVYFTRYAEAPNWLITVGVAEGRPALLAHDRADPAGPPAFVVVMEWAGDRIAAIRDFHYARYVMDGLEVGPA